MDSIDRMRIALIIAALLAGISALAQPINRNPWTTNSAVVVSNLTLGLIRDNGSTITNLNAGNISAGTLADARLSANVSLLGATITEGELSFSDVTTRDATAIAHGLLPKLSGSAGDVLHGDGTWGAASSGTPGGSDTQVQFNDVGAFGGDAGLTYDKTTDTLTVAGNVNVAVSVVAQGTISAGPSSLVILGDDGRIEWAGGIGVLNTSGGAAFGAAVATTGIFHGDGSGLSNVVAAAQYSDTAFASSWNGVTTIAPTKNAVYDHIHLFDTDDNGKVDILANTAATATLGAAGQVSVNTVDKLLGIHNGTKEVAIPLIEHREFSFDPKAVCDGAVDRLFLFKIGAWAPKGITVTGWRASFEADPTTEVDLDLKRADAFIGVANSAVMDVLDTTAGVSSETSFANINGGVVVANGKVIYLEFGTAYTETTHQIIFEIEYEIEED